MNAFRSLSRAMALGLLRDRTAVFFTLLFPLMFLALFGVLTQDVFSAVLIMVMATTLITPPVLKALFDREGRREGERPAAVTADDRLPPIPPGARR